ncbi:hypothetical protein GP2_024_01080 [Gordonia paraffinivorans NBRC 108238]|uniref:AttH domain-containing protein n=1 Tax=Gordonia paraffinivorans NBRC 108238 TaxID=1223543 RepID=A0ABQ0IP18_9ACTN|nr:hypothetical protein [Gordonia paraffinivorans]GAC84681.1 hypothetical protein GP2_024_01080 [Gordonia paraffinivorans NBRC 108238]
MSTSTSQQFHDPLVGRETEGLPAGFFDRFMFNMHPVAGGAPSVIMGHGRYPLKDTVDGFVVVSTETEQRNLRYASKLSAAELDGAGPFRFEVVEPNQQWRLQLAPNEIGVEFDITWQARTPAWFGTVAVQNDSGTPTSFDHLFQSGFYTGTLSIDGQTRSVDGWYGQRDRSRGVRTMSGGQGLHIWYQAQFPEFAVGFLLVETRDHQRLLLEGAVMHTDGTLDPIVDVKHSLSFSDGLDLEEGTVEVTTAAGQTYRMQADARSGGGYMAGAGYGGHHGKDLGIDHVESDSFPLDGSVSPKTLDSALTDRLATFDLDGVPGSGIFEFALTRSSRYQYRPTL